LPKKLNTQTLMGLVLSVRPKNEDSTNNSGMREELLSVFFFRNE